MKLARLQLENFKNFKGFHTVYFSDGFSIVIGANGAGKSSIVDAIAFLIGYSRKSLGLASYDDLVYNDAFSQDNADKCSVFGEFITDEGVAIELKRSIRLGQNEVYTIDSEVVTKRQYKETLMQNRVDAKLFGSIIPQGTIESLMCQGSSKMEFFEKSCGSFAFKAPYEKKKEELRKISMKIVPLNGRVKQLTKDIETIKSVQTVCDRKKALQNSIEENQKKVLLTNLQLNKLVLDDISEKMAAIEEVAEDEIKSLVQETQNLFNNHVQPLALKREELKSEYEKVDAACESLKVREQCLQKNMMCIELDITKAKEKNDNIAKKKTDCEDEIKVISAELERVETLVRNIEAELKKHDQTKLSFEQNLELAKREQKFDIQNTKMIEKLTNMQHELAVLENKLEFTEQKIQEEQFMLKFLENELSNSRVLKKTIEDTRNETEGLSQNIRSEFEKLRNDFEYAKANEKTTREKLMNAERKLGQMKETFNRHQRKGSKSNTFQKLQQNFGSKNVIGFFGDLVASKQRKYNSAFQKVFKRYNEWILVTDQETCAKCVQLLKLWKQSITIVVLNQVESFSQMRVFMKNAPATIKLMSDVVEVTVRDDVIKRQVQALVGKVTRDIVVCASHDEFVKFKKEHASNLKISGVMLDGSMIHKNGTFDLSYEPASFSKHNIESSIQLQRDETEALRNQLSEMEAVLKKENELKERESEFQIKVFESKDLEAKLNGICTSIADLERKIFEHNESLTQKKAEKDEIAQEISAQKEAQTGLAERIKESKKKIVKKFYEENNIIFDDEVCVNMSQQMRGLEQRFRDVLDERNRCESALESAKDVLKKLNIEEEKLVSTIDSLQGTKQTIEKDLEGISANLSRTSKRLSNVKEKCDATEKELQDFQQKQEIIEEKLSEKRKLNNQNMVTKHCLERSKKDVLSKNEAIMRDLRAIDAEMYDEVMEPLLSSSSSPESVGDLSILLERFENLNVNLEDASTSQSDLEKMISSLKKQIAKDTKELNEIALRFDAEFDDVSTRTRADMDNVKRELSQLLQERETVHKQFEELKTLRTEKITDYLRRLEGTIDKTYKWICNDPSAQMSINFANDSDGAIFDQDINISVIPPKGVYDDFVHLSGGQKSIAVFAILMAMWEILKPGFMVFDEMDSALSESNCAKCARVLAEAASALDQQFISVSHRKAFLSHANYVISVSTPSVFNPEQNAESSRIIVLNINNYTRDIMGMEKSCLDEMNTIYDYIHDDERDLRCSLYDISEEAQTDEAIREALKLKLSQ